jgi:hypothetical protein
MGGFEFKGPNYIFRNKPTIVNGQIVMCRCMGFSSNISKQMEEYLEIHLGLPLNLNDIPDQELAKRMQRYHLGNNMEYTMMANRPESPHKYVYPYPDPSYPRHGRW